MFDPPDIAQLSNGQTHRDIGCNQAHEWFAIDSAAADIAFWDAAIEPRTFRSATKGPPQYDLSRSNGEPPHPLWPGGLHPDDRKGTEQALDDAINGGLEFSAEFRIVYANGELRHLNARGRVVRDGAGKPVQLIGVTVDVTQRKRAANAVRESEQRYRFLAEAMPQIIWTAAPDGKVDYYNHQWYAYTGLSHEQTDDRGWEHIIHPMDLHSCLDRWAHTIATGGNYEIECRFKRAIDNTYRWHLVRASPLRAGDGTIRQWVGTCTDIDDQKHAQEQLREAYASLEQRVIARTTELSAAKAVAERADKAKSEFLTNMSHEIRTPLNAVIGLGYLLEQTTLTEGQQEYLSKIQFAGRSLLSLVNNVLDLAKIEANEVLIEDEVFDLSDLLLNVRQMLASQAAAKGVELVVDQAANLPRMVVGDVSRLRQILINLLNNALKFTDTGRVELKAYCTEQGIDNIRLRCEVIDTGIGIEPAAMKRIFLPFAQADASTTRRFGGTGLGLSIACQLVELMGGRIDAISAVGVGSTFWFELPLRIEHSIDRTVRTRGVRIAIVDSGRDGVTEMVRALGWVPQIFPTGEQLLRFLDSAQPSEWPDVLIVQMHLADMDAHQLIARIETAHTSTEAPPTIFVTGCAQTYLAHQPLIRAMDAMLVLPLTSSALFNAVNTAASQRPDGLDSMLHSNTDLLHAQWLVGVRVLVVDDSALNREVAEGILQYHGAIVSACTDGRAALEYVRAHHQELDVVLMDVQMPIMDGTEATRLIRTELTLPTLPIVALTAAALVSERQRALNAGMNDIVTKPFDPLELIRKVRYLVEQTRDEPIPIAILDRKRALRAPEAPDIPSIDSGVVKQMFGEDLPLFKSALSHMLRDFSEFAVPITLSLDDEGARGELMARVHALKGSAGMIGATRLMRLAAAAETALEQGRSIDIVGPITGRLISAFSDMRDESQFWLEGQTALEVVPKAVAAPRATPDTADVDELYALLDTRNLAALDQFSVLSLTLSELLGASHFSRLRDAVDHLDFPLAAQLLREGRGQTLA